MQDKLEAQLQGGEGQPGLATEPSMSAVRLWGSGSQTSTGDDAKPRPLLQGICSLTRSLEHLSISSLAWAAACSPSRHPSKNTSVSLSACLLS